MNNLYLPFVMPIFRQHDNVRSFAGTAFCIDDYLVTAAHVLQSPTTHYVRNGNDFHPLHFDQWIPQQLPASDRLGYDIAFYPVPGLKSPLQLSSCDPEPEDEVEIACWQWLSGGLEQVTTRALVLKEADERGYARLATVDHITHGSSGCPVIIGNEVVGMVTMGRTAVDAPHLPPLNRRMEQNTCWAFKTSYIKRFLPRLR